MRKLQAGEPVLGAAVSVSDPTITEALADSVDFVWIDQEHNPLSMGEVQGHIMATKGSPATPIVRVPWNDHVMIKRVLDAGAAGIIVPMVRTATEARRAVEACLYPPDGIRGYGPRRPSNYGRRGGVDFVRDANAAVIPILQIEHVDAVEQIDAIVAVPGIASLVFGPNDLAGSMGLLGEPHHPKVAAAIDHVIARARAAGVFVGSGMGGTAEQIAAAFERGMHWSLTGIDYAFMLHALHRLLGDVQRRLPRATSAD